MNPIECFHLAFQIFIALFAIFMVSATSEKKGDEKDAKDLEQSASLGWGWGWPSHGWGWVIPR